ncbi:hypothetical protein HN385_03020 [archaeon]|nr:hypothetical protein [archaeon]MBT3450840.1 hypothetical protein [archaeon]MBT6868451.1 hypothetical protein [archaeon]MBT7193550.1 hypothetical protein [archaeon]MBT7381255.1 hypothetical protein [archaeon]
MFGVQIPAAPYIILLKKADGRCINVGEKTMDYLQFHDIKIPYQGQELGIFLNGSYNTYLSIDVERIQEQFNFIPKDDCIKSIDNFLKKSETDLREITGVHSKRYNIPHYKVQGITNSVNLMRDVLDALRGTQ